MQLTGSLELNEPLRFAVVAEETDFVQHFSKYTNRLTGMDNVLHKPVDKVTI